MGKKKKNLCLFLLDTVFKYRMKKNGYGAFAAEVGFSHHQVVPKY